MTEKRKIIHLSMAELGDIYESTDTVAEVAKRYNTTEQIVKIIQQMRPVQPNADRDRTEYLREKLEAKAKAKTEAKAERLETKKQQASKQPRLQKKTSRTRKR